MRKVLFLILCSAAAVGWLVFFKQSLHSTPTHQTKPTTEVKKIQIIDLSKTNEHRLMNKIISACPQIISSTGIGTGFLFEDNGLIITALHVVDDDTAVNVKFFTVTDDYNNLLERETVSGRVVGWSSDDYDVAFIRIDTIPKGVTPLQGAPKETFIREQPVWRFGYNDHYKWSQGMYSPTLCNGSRCIITMPAGPGASGGPLVDGRGRVMGIFQSYNASENSVVTDSDLTRAIEFTPVKAHFLPLHYITIWIELQNL